MKVWEGEENLIENYRKLASKFAELGHKTDVLCYCDECASFLFPSDSKWSTNNIVFSFLANGLNTPNYSNISNLPVYSFPSTRRYSDFEYEVALSFLKGADTIEKLSEDTGTKLDSEVYLKHVRNVIGSTDI